MYATSGNQKRKKGDGLMNFMEKCQSTKLKKTNVTNPEGNKAVVMRSCNCHCACGNDSYNNIFGANHGNIMYINGG
jgi:hypothetical protein